MEAASNAARAGAEVLLRHFRGLHPHDIRTKTQNDFVSFVDRESETAIRGVILDAFPGHEFLGEEHGSVGGGAWRWIVDPLDGTSNYVHGVPQFAISIALQHKGRLVVGLVYDPIRGDEYVAERGGGAWRNGERLRVADRQPMEDALIGTGFPFRARQVFDDYMATFREIFPRVSDVRRPGSAALDFAFVASGATAGFWEFALSPWDIAAGALLIEEAGGVITDFAGGDSYLSSGNVVTGAPQIHRELLACVQKVLRERGRALA
ncbi:MAG TPA: inositol monophosphatase family protein [Candidatus Latescibacteria bacterium]|nr:inositol monophosphatase family protein [Candidatus Latescibacterota bacterium]